jgi:hypothetical protein
MRNEYNIAVGMAGGMTQLGRIRCTWNNNRYIKE